MFVRIWQYEVAAKAIPQFRRTYARSGSWARLFEETAGFLGTELYANVDVVGRFVTIDRWGSRSEWAAFRSEHAAAYEELDAMCEQLTVSEVELAAGELPAPAS